MTMSGCVGHQCEVSVTATNYSGHEESVGPDPAVMLWFCSVSYIISTILCLTSLYIFQHYTKLWCLRNVIHANFIGCIAVHNMAWLFTALVFMTRLENCTITVILIEISKFCVTSTFCWMLVEGVYLYMSILHCLYAYHIKYVVCALIGWGLPAILFVRKAFIANSNFLENLTTCAELDENLDDWTVWTIVGIICINVIILLAVIYVLFTKFRQVEHKEWLTLRQVFRALLFLCPLLGISYTFTIYQPQHPQWLSNFVAYYTVGINATQGTIISVCFCFYNDEVRSCIRRSVQSAYYFWSVRVHEMRRKSLDGSQLTFLGSV